MLFGVIFDNITLFLAPHLLGSNVYLLLNKFRFATHALLLPLLIPFGLSVLHQSGSTIAANKLLVGALSLITIGALYFGIHHEIVHLTLGEKSAYGYTRLAAVGDTLPPIGTIVANLILMVMGIALWKRAGWKWMFLGALFIFALNAATGAKEYGVLVGNFAEVVFIFSLLLTERWVSSTFKTS